jgi:hypothetical protein
MAINVAAGVKRRTQTQQSNRGSSGGDERKEVSNVVQKSALSLPSYP